MTKFDKILVRAAGVGVLVASLIVGVWFGWQVAVGAVINNVKLGQANYQLEQQLKACEAKSGVQQPKQ